MTKYLIKWDAGFGEDYDVVEAENEDVAAEWAYQKWKEEAESQASYEAEILTPELAEEYSLEGELED